MENRLFLKTQSELLGDIKTRMRDTGSSVLASDPEYYAAINDALGEWRGRVQVPQLYTFSLQSGVYDYALPDYVHPPMRVEVRTPTYFLHGVFVPTTDETSFTWGELASWNVEPDGDGGFKLRLSMYPLAEEARIIWWHEQGTVPDVAIANQPELNSGISDTGTSLTVDTRLDAIGSSGYVKVNDEWMSYAGVDRGSGTTTLNNLERGLYQTTAASHSTSDDVLWGIAADDYGLYNQLMMRTMANVHAQLLHKAAGEDNDHHQRMLSYYGDQAQRWWRGYTPGRTPRFRLGRRIHGKGAW